jgi:hypothetical protein
MRILTGLLTIALLTPVAYVAPAAAQCSMLCPTGKDAAKAKAKRAHHRHDHHGAMKKHKKHAHEIYMRAAPY